MTTDFSSQGGYIKSDRHSDGTKQYFMRVEEHMINKASQVLASFNITVIFEGNVVLFADQNDAYKAATRVHMYGIKILESNMDLSQA